MPGKPREAAVVADPVPRRQLARRLYDAWEEERRRIAGELHDSVGGQLTGVEIMAALLYKRLQKESSPHATAAKELLENLREVHVRLRAVSRGLLPVEDDPRGLMSALRRLTSMYDDLDGVRCRFVCDEEVEVYDPCAATSLYQVAEEALRNAGRRAGPGEVGVELACSGGEITLTVRHHGASLADPSANGGGMGLESMAGRIDLVGGRLEIEPGAPAGTLLRCIVPAMDEPV
jgi:two-component system NarL family sensor kinase